MAHPYEMVTSLLGGSTTPSSILSSFPNDATDTSPWIAFLHQDEHLDEFTQRNDFLSHLIDNPTSDSFALLARLVELHSNYVASLGKKWRGEIVLFGSDFIQQIAQYLTSHFQDEDGSILLLQALLRPNRPRNEVAHDEIHSLILLPLSKSHPTALAEVVLESVVWNVMQITAGDQEEVAMKRETAALGKLQDLREVIENIAKYCVECFKEGKKEEGGRIVRSFEWVHDVAAYALESQLETLLDEDSSYILDNFSNVEEKEQGAVQDTVDGMQMDSQEVVGLPPLYESLTAGPMNLPSMSQLVETLDAIHDKLSITESERWDERLGALVDLERILASSLEGESRSVFIEKIRKMALPEQFADLRSQVTHAACRVLLCTSFEYRNFIEEDSALIKPLHQFVEYCLPALMKLCTSGTRLMSTQGVACVQSICVTSVGHSRILTTLCQDIVDKKSKNNNRRRAAVMGLTAALRVWDESCINNVELIGNAVKAASSDKDPGVREDGRKAYWAMRSCDKTRSKAEEMYAERSREYRNLVKVKFDIDAEWDEEGKLCYLLNTGILLEEGKNKVASTGTGRPSTAPSRVNSNKRSAVIKDRTTPAKKAGRFTTYTPEVAGSSPKQRLSAKLTANTSSTKLPMDTPVSRRTTFAPSSITKTSGSKTESFEPERKSMATVNTKQTDSSTKVKRGTPAQASLTSGVYNEKENSPTPISHSSPKVGTPVVSTLARPSPLSIEKCRSRNALNQVVTMLSDPHNPSEQYLGIQVLALFAKDHSEHESWDKMFGVVLELLISLVRNTQTNSCYDTLHFARSPSNKNLGSRYEAQHLYLQGLRSLLQFVPGRFNETHINNVAVCLLESTNGPFEIAFTCERGLHNLVTSTNPEVCFDCLLPYLSNAQVDLDSTVNPPLLLTILRTLKPLVEYIQVPKLRQVTPELIQLFQSTIRHKSVDMRKATVFVIVEMHFVLGEEFTVDGFSDGQKRLIYVYVERHPKKSAMLVG